MNSGDWDNAKGDSVIGGVEESEISRLLKAPLPEVESSWRINELTDGVVAVEIGSLFQKM